MFGRTAAPCPGARAGIDISVVAAWLFTLSGGQTGRGLVQWVACGWRWWKAMSSMSRTFLRLGCKWLVHRLGCCRDVCRSLTKRSLSPSPSLLHCTIRNSSVRIRDTVCLPLTSSLSIYSAVGDQYCRYSEVSHITYALQERAQALRKPLVPPTRICASPPACFCPQNNTKHPPSTLTHSPWSSTTTRPLRRDSCAH